MESTISSFILGLEREILAPLVTLLALGAFVLFIWGVVNMIRNGENEEKRSDGQKHMIWGIIGLVIIFGANAIIKILTSTLGLP